MNTKPNILIIEDDEEWREKLGTPLAIFKDKYDIYHTTDYSEAKALISTDSCVLAITNIMIDSNDSESINIDNWKQFISFAGRRIPIIAASSGDFSETDSITLMKDYFLQYNFRAISKKYFDTHKKTYIKDASNFISKFEKIPKPLSMEDRESLSKLLSNSQFWFDQNTRKVLLRDTEIPKEKITSLSLHIPMQDMCAKTVIFELEENGTLLNASEYTALGSLIYTLFRKEKANLNYKKFLGEIIIRYNLIFDATICIEIQSALNSLEE